MEILFTKQQIADRTRNGRVKGQHYPITKNGLNTCCGFS